MIRGNTQILDATINWEKLESDFLDGADWDVTNGAHNATITGLADPVNNRDVSTKQYVDNLVQGIQGSFVARVKAQANVASLSGAQTIDSVALVDGDNILLGDQTTVSEDGLYVVRTGAWERVSGWEVGENAGAFFVFIEEGSDDNKGFVCSNDKGSDVIGTDDLVFVQFSGAGTINAGAGLTQNGSDIDVVATDLSLTVNANDMAVNIGTTNGNSLEVSATGLELLETVTGTRTFSTGGTDFTIDASTTGTCTISANVLDWYAYDYVSLYGATQTAIGSFSGTSSTEIIGYELLFSSDEVRQATNINSIPFAITATVNYGNGNGTAAGDVINQFRTDFTDDGIINALCELKANITSSTNTFENGLTNTTGTVRLGGALTQNTTIDLTSSRSLFITGDSGTGQTSDFEQNAGSINLASTNMADTSSFIVSGGNINNNVTGNVNFADGEVNAATVTTAIPFAITATVNYGNGNGTAAGDIVNQFRTDFTDDGIINALCQVKAELDTYSVTTANGISTVAGVVELGGSLTKGTSINANYHELTYYGNRDLTNYAEVVNFGMSAGGEISDFNIHATQTFTVDSTTLTVQDYVNGYTIGSQPDGTVANAIATVQYVDNQVAGANTRKYNNVTTLNIGNQTATLTTAPTTGFVNGVVYLNGVRQILTTDYTVTNATTGEITFTAAQTIVAGDVVIMDYSDQ
jgi:hypothetical protein